ncbi:MAG: hypothetical protein ACXV5N_05180 [Halobacteriota archaeon]
MYIWDSMREEYESVGDLSFYLDDQVQTGQGFVRCSIQRDEIHAGTFEDPRATVDGLADIYGIIFLDPKEDQRLFPQLYQHLKTDQYIQLDGDFINRQTNAFMPLRLVVHFSRIDMSSPETIVCEFDSAHISMISKGLLTFD